jgi:ribosome-binding factor A
MSKRIEQVNSLLEHEIGKIILREFYFPGTMITLTHVDASANLFEAKVFISCYPDKKLDEIIEILNKNIARIQHEINDKLKMRPVPRIKFFRDKDLAKAGKIEELLVKIKEEEKIEKKRKIK